MRSFLQTDWWGDFKASQGWQVDRQAGRFGLYKEVGFKRGIRYWPELPWLDKTELNALRQAPKRPGLIVERYEFLEEYDQQKVEFLGSLGLKKTAHSVQPEYRQWLDLRLTKEQILAQMTKPGRAPARAALANPLTIERGLSDELAERLYRLYLATAVRSGFSPRSQDYFSRLAATLAKENAGEIIIAAYQGDDLAAGLFVYFGGVSSYLYAGSAADHRLKAPYRIQFEAFNEARRRGCTIHDLLAVAPPDSVDHRHARIGKFKQQFGGRTVRLIGSWDDICSPFWYKGFTLMERVKFKERS